MPMYIVPQVLSQIKEKDHIEIRNGSVMRDLLFVEDCIEAVLKLAVTSGGEDGTFNIGSGHIVSISELAKAAAEASGHPDVLITDLEEIIEYSPAAIMDDIDKVQATIEWYPKTSLTKGLRQMWETMNQNDPSR